MISVAVLPFVAVPCRAENGPDLSTSAAAQLDEGLKHLYGLEYPESRAAFHKLIELEPDNPFGYLFEAGGIWWESSQEYGLFTDTPTLQGTFEDDIQRALKKADAYIDSEDPRRKADGYFVSGMTLGTLGQWRLMKRHWMDAFFIGKKAIKNLKKCAKLDPDYADARLGLGVFDYQASRLSGVMKLGALLGFRGDEKRGLEEIRDAMDRSRYSGHQAAELLALIYLSDLHDDPKALEVLRRLRQDYPDSAYFMYLEALALHRLGRPDESLAAARTLFARVAADPPAFRPKWLTLVCGLSGRDCLAPDDVDRALTWFDRAVQLTAGETPDPFQTFLHAARGQLLDVRGRREEALAEYRRTLALPAFDDLHERASACAAAPCDRKSALQRLRSMAKTD